MKKATGKAHTETLHDGGLVIRTERTKTSYASIWSHGTKVVYVEWTAYDKNGDMIYDGSKIRNGGKLKDAKTAITRHHIKLEREEQEKKEQQERIANSVKKRSTPIGHVPDGSRFYCPELQLEGTLVHSNDCRARVKLHGKQQKKTIKGKTFMTTKTTYADWALTVMVQIIETPNKENGATTMATTSTKKTTKKAATKKTTPKKEAVQCGCGCGEMTRPGSKFRPGHDARFHGRIRKICDGRLKMADLIKELGAKGKYAVAAYKASVKDHGGAGSQEPPQKKKRAATKKATTKKTTKKKGK